jgi:hypothetical protein
MRRKSNAIGSAIKRKSSARLLQLIQIENYSMRKI